MNELVKQGIYNVLGQEAKRALGLAVEWGQKSWQSSGTYDKTGMVVSIGIAVGVGGLCFCLWQKGGADGNLLNPLRNSLDAVV